MKKCRFLFAGFYCIVAKVDIEHFITLSAELFSKTRLGSANTQTQKGH